MPKVQVTKSYFKTVCESLKMEGDVTDFESEVSMLLAFFRHSLQERFHALGFSVQTEFSLTH